MAANRNEQLAKELGYQWSLKSWVEYDDSLLSKPQDQLTGYDKATLNINPDLKAKREAYQASLARSNKLQSDLSNIQEAQQFLQNNVSQQKERINKLYDLQDKAAAISASIQWTNRTAWWLWAASNVLGNSRWITDAQMQQQILQNSAQRESALANVAQQEANIPSVLASLDQAKASSELARAQAKYYNNQWTSSSSNWWYSYNKNPDKKEEQPKEISNWKWGSYTFEWGQLKDKDWNVVFSWWLLEYWGNLYNADTLKLVYDKENNKWYWLTVPKVEPTSTGKVGKKITDDMNPALYNPTLRMSL